MSASLREAPIEAGDPADDSAAYRRCLGQFATGITVVTARADERLAGVTANSFSSVSLKPPLVAWSIKQESQSHPVFAAASHFAVNVLSSEQIALSQHFGRSGPDKFETVTWSEGRGGAPLLAGAVATFECRVAARHEGGDHTIMLGEVERFSRHPGEVLLFVQGRYGRAADHPATRVAVDQIASGHAAGPMNDFLAALLYRAHAVISAGLERERRAEGYTLLQSRILAAIDTFPGSTVDGLKERLFLGSNITRSIVQQLSEQGLLAASGGELALSAHGRDRLNVLLERTHRVEQEMLAGIPEDELQTARRVLTRIIGLGIAS